VLFRGASEGKIRQTIIEKFNFLDAVIGLPANLFYGAGIPACILIFRKNRGANERVLFIDASGDGHYEKGKNQNVLREEDITKILETYETYLNDQSFAGEEKYSYVATLDEIKENDYNLNIPRYVDTFEEEELIDIDEVKANIKNIEDELSKVQKQMAKYMKELGL
jgi:type I restriction enzyme M protein